MFHALYSLYREGKGLFAQPGFLTWNGGKRAKYYITRNCLSIVQERTTRSTSGYYICYLYIVRCQTPKILQGLAMFNKFD